MKFLFFKKHVFTMNMIAFEFWICILQKGSCILGIFARTPLSFCVERPRFISKKGRNEKKRTTRIVKPCNIKLPINLLYHHVFVNFERIKEIHL